MHAWFCCSICHAKANQADESTQVHLFSLCLHAGRVQTILLFKIIGVNLMGFMGLYPEIWTKLGVIIPVYVVRTAIINSAYPLQKSILMDYVPKVSIAFTFVACMF